MLGDLRTMAVACKHLMDLQVLRMHFLYSLYFWSGGTLTERGGNHSFWTQSDINIVAVPGGLWSGLKLHLAVYK